MQTNTIISIESIADKIKKYQLFVPDIARKAKPGQFVIIRLNDQGERIPLTIVDSHYKEGTIILIVQEVGKSTHLLAEMKAGDRILDVVGPLGNSSEIKRYGNVVVVGGGVGTAVSYPVAKALKSVGNHVTTIIGARTKDLIILEDEVKAISDECYLTTDDGSYGFHGFVTQKLQSLIDAGHHFDRVFAIGPLQMMRAVAELTRPLAIPTIVSLNTIMVDGTGMCGGCRVRVGNENRFTCVDGPEFDGHLVDFSTLINRNRAYLHEEQCALDASIASLKSSRTQDRLKIPRQVMPERSVEVRIKNFEEVNLGFSEEIAILEAQRCLHCRKPSCVEGCPVGVKIPEFIKLLEKREFLASARKIQEDNVLAKVCARVCPQSDQCEGACILTKRGDAVAIGALARFVTDFARAHASIQEKPAVQKTGFKVAVIGSGPAGLSCAGDLIRAGHDVTVFEAFHDFGGVLIYGIPEFRLPKDIVREEVSALKDLGVRFQANTVIGITLTIDELFDQEGFDAAFISVGAGLPNFMNLPGENLIGIYSANEFLTRVNLMKAWQFPRVDTPVLDLRDKHVAVIGGGNTALDSARVALRLGASHVDIIYRRSENEMPGRLEEIKHAKHEGIQFQFLSTPVEFLGDENGWLKTIRLMHMSLGEPDSSGRRRPQPIPGSEFNFSVDMTVIAIGNGSNPIIQKTTPDLKFNRWGHIEVDEETLSTSKPGVFAGGDIVTGGATVILAMGAGRRAATAINAYLLQNKQQI
jgi:glutamate synthase (NADPH/NADH) small chain